MLLLKNCEVYSPRSIGKKDILILGGKIRAIKDNLDEYLHLPELNVVDCTERIAFPGFIDPHVHICGGGGEGGFKTRTPEIKLSDLTRAGITTVVGCLGTDGIGRSVENLIAKAKGLKEEGISAYVYTGSYQVPVRTLTGDIIKDIMMIDEIIGVGEVAISDHRSSQPEKQDVKKLISDARVGGMLAGKSGIVNMHIGDGERMMDMINEIIRETELPYTQILPTHMNRNSKLLANAIEYAKSGGLIDFTTSSTPQDLAAGEIKASDAFKICIDEDVPMERITFSSDGQGSLPSFDDHGNLIGLKIGSPSSLYESVRELIFDCHIPIENAIGTITRNPASTLKLESKGRIEVGKDSDIVLVDKTSLEIRTVIAKGRIMLQDNRVIVKDTFSCV